MVPHSSTLISFLCPLQLSPKKTWEGFIGGFFSTIVFGILVKSDHIYAFYPKMSLCCNWRLISFQLSYVMAGYRYFVCPVEFNNDSNSFQVDCEPSELFQLQDYVLPSILESATGWVSIISLLYPLNFAVWTLRLVVLIWSMQSKILPY